MFAQVILAIAIARAAAAPIRFDSLLDFLWGKFGDYRPENCAYAPTFDRVMVAFRQNIKPGSEGYKKLMRLNNLDDWWALYSAPTIYASVKDILADDGMEYFDDMVQNTATWSL